jgi:hypothetical protein
MDRKSYYGNLKPLFGALLACVLWFDSLAHVAKNGFDPNNPRALSWGCLGSTTKKTTYFHTHF